MEIKNVFVVGAGFMGNGIAEMAALAGYQVTMSDLSEERLDAGMREIESSLGKFKAKEKITGEQYDSALGNLSTTTTLEDAGGADLLVEAVPEKLALKKEIFAALDGICPGETILATNTSAISISAIASATRRPHKVVGTHFFGPVPLMRLCEVIKGLLTAEDTLEAAGEWARSLGKEIVVVRRDHAGFIANRVTVPGSLEAVRLVEEGAASPGEIDAAATLGSERRAGPMQIMDNAGIDVAFNTAMAIYEDTGEPRFYPPPLMRRMVSANLLGRKSGRGFYDYTSDKREPYDVTGAGAPEGVGQDTGEGLDKTGIIVRRILLPNILESVRMVEAGIAVPQEIDRASRLGFNLPMGPLELADAMGLDEVLRWSLEIHESTGNFNYFPPSLLRRMAASGRHFY